RVLQIPAGAEGIALAGDHQDELIPGVAEALPGVMQLAVHLPVDGVPLLRTREGEDGDVTIPFVAQGLVVHRASLLGPGTLFLSRAEAIPRASRCCRPPAPGRGRNPGRERRTPPSLEFPPRQSGPCSSAGRRRSSPQSR